MCVEDIKHVMHLFLDCEFVKDCWQLMGLNYNTWETENASDWLLDKICNESEDSLVKIAIVL